MSNYRVVRGLSRGHQYFEPGTIINVSSFKDVDDLLILVESLDALAKEGALETTEEEVTYLQADIPFVLDEAPESPPEIPAAPEPPAGEPPAQEPKKGRK